MQFTISIVLIIGTLVVYKQINHAKGRPIGYSRDGLVSTSASDVTHKSFEAIRTELKNSGAIVEMTESGSPTTDVWNTNGGFDWEGKDPNLAVDFPNNAVTYEYGKTIGWKILQGRDFSRDYATDSSAFIMVIIALLIAIPAVWLVLPLFNDMAAKQMTATSLFTPYILPLLIALPFVVGLLAGSYPAFFLSAFRPIEVLKGKLKLGTKSGGLRSILVVFQFATSIILIIGTVVVYKQLHYIQTRNLGFNKDQVLIVNGVSALNNNMVPFKNEVLQLQGVSGGTLSGYLPVANSYRSDNT